MSQTLTRRGFVWGATMATANLAGSALGASGGGLAQGSGVGTQDGTTLTAMTYITVREGVQQTTEDFLRDLIAASRSEGGCLAYVFYQEVDNARQFVVFEQWRDAAALSAHFQHLQELYGPPRQGANVPASILERFESIRGVPYRVFV